MAWMLELSGLFLLNQGAVDRAVDHLARALSAKRRLFGEDDPGTLRTQLELAEAHRESGDTEQAITLSLDAVLRCLRALEQGHPETLSSWSVLAAAYRAAGNMRQAIPAYQTALDARRQALAEDHQITLGACNDLADMYRFVETWTTPSPCASARWNAVARLLARSTLRHFVPGTTSPPPIARPDR